MVRKEDVIIPSGDTVVRNGDQVILFTLPDNLSSIEETFRPFGYQAS